MIKPVCFLRVVVKIILKVYVFLKLKLSYSAQVIIIHHWVFQFNQTILNLRQIHEIIKFFDATNDKNPLFEFNNVRIIKNRDWLLIKLQK